MYSEWQKTGMTSCRIVLVVLISTMAAAAEELPVVSAPVTVDYAAHRVDTSRIQGTKITEFKIFHSGDWTKLESPTRTVYNNALKKLIVMVGWNVEARQNYLAIFRNRPITGSIDTKRNLLKTNDKDTALGEECEVWKTEYSSAEQLSCLTRDGIELWNRLTSRANGVISERHLTQLERRPILPKDTHPPSGLLQQNVSTMPRTKSDAPFLLPDHEVVLADTRASASPEAASGRETIRRRCPWTYTEIQSNGIKTRIDIRSPKDGVSLLYAKAPNGAESLVKSPLLPGKGCDDHTPSVRLMGIARYEFILDRLCHWYTPQMITSHSQSLSCETWDNITLKNTLRSDFGSNSYDRTAISLRRGPVEAKDVMLPAELRDPAYWGLPE